MRNGWVFQPKSCVLDTFSYEDLMLLASLDNESTWLLVLGGSVQRGVFLTLIDMVLAAGQKHDISSSVLQKCWGYADVRIGNLRLTYQVCSDCPRGLVPFHVKSMPEPVCEIVESLREQANKGEVWTGDLCPDWCMKQAPVSQTMTESDVVNVRECKDNTGQP
ncbi:unnamed protein product [Ectocarpus sp. 6 AP-2014]